MTREVERTEDGHWIVVDGRRWRTACTPTACMCAQKLNCNATGSSPAQ